RFVGYVLQTAMPKEPLNAAGIDVNAPDLKFTVREPITISAEQSSAVIDTPEKQNLFVMLR
ncbi:MAG: hypothetical protein ACOVP8_05975, partial [Phycisphaerales bacterium]